MPPTQQSQFPYNILCQKAEPDVELQMAPATAGEMAKSFDTGQGRVNVKWCALCPHSLRCDFGIRISLLGMKFPLPPG